MKMTTLWPPRTHDGSALIHAYADLLGWPLLSQGRRVSAQTAEHQLVRPGPITLRTTCTAFDAVTVAHRVGASALVWIEREIGLVPCLSQGHAAMTFLVQPGTSADLAALEGISCTTGTGQISLPPSAGVRWDTPPWQAISAHREPLPLHAAAHLKPGLRDALRLHGNVLP
ncbi:hypothetical protein ACH4PU_32555 [Streptomyces sp. NPDC021100]|uniref:hypothetical protein n=1 Tax=Streptomyces sp. NPDC021100 TaxID=3365114 RepID=UPI003795D1A1